MVPRGLNARSAPAHFFFAPSSALTSLLAGAARCEWVLHQAVLVCHILHRGPHRITPSLILVGIEMWLSYLWSSHHRVRYSQTKLPLFSYYLYYFLKILGNNLNKLYIVISILNKLYIVISIVNHFSDYFHYFPLVFSCFPLHYSGIWRLWLLWSKNDPMGHFQEEVSGRSKWQLSLSWAAINLCCPWLVLLIIFSIAQSSNIGYSIWALVGI